MTTPKASPTLADRLRDLAATFDGVTLCDEAIPRDMREAASMLDLQAQQIARLKKVLRDYVEVHGCQGESRCSSHGAAREALREPPHA